MKKKIMASEVDSRTGFIIMWVLYIIFLIVL